MIIAIDGPAGTGKGTISALISKRLGYLYIDTGAMYRAITLKMIRQGVELADFDKIKDILENTILEFRNIDGTQKIFMDDEDVSKEIRMPEVTGIVSQVSSIKMIREELVKQQRRLGEQSDVIMEGRDITTVVFPNAELKIYLTADLEERAKRRYEELIQKGVTTTYEETFENVRARDENDMKKEMGALKIAEDAIVVDSTKLTIEEVYNEIEKLIKEKRG